MDTCNCTVHTDSVNTGGLDYLDDLTPGLTIFFCTLNERQRRQLAGCLLNAAPVGTKKKTVEKLKVISGLCRTTIKTGAREMAEAKLILNIGDIEELEYFIYNDKSTSNNNIILPDTNEAVGGSNSEAKVITKENSEQVPSKRGRKIQNPIPRKFRVRAKGAGRPVYLAQYPDVHVDLEPILTGYSGGDPESDRVWTSLSEEHLIEELGKILSEDGSKKYGETPSRTVIRKALSIMGYSLQQNKKYIPMVANHPDREKQFDNINHVKDAFKNAINGNLTSGDSGEVMYVSDAAKEILAEAKRKALPVPTWHSLDESLGTSHEISDEKPEETNEHKPVGIIKLDRHRGYSFLGKIYKKKRDAVADFNLYLATVKIQKTIELCEFIEEQIRDDKAICLSGDAKNTELIGKYAQNGKEYCKKGKGLRVNDHDFKKFGMKDNEGIIIPYGIYDIVLKKGYVSLGRTHDTAQFAVDTLRSYLTDTAPKYHPGFTTVFYFCDGGGCNSSRSRMWKYELIKLAKDLGITIVVMHYPPGTSKYNAIEHMMFSQISKNWRGRPLETVGTAMNLINATHTKTGLSIECHRNDKFYATGFSVSDKQFKVIQRLIFPFSDCEDWNYIIHGPFITDSDLDEIGTIQVKERTTTAKNTDTANANSASSDDSGPDASKQPRKKRKNGKKGKSGKNGKKTTQSQTSHEAAA